MPQQFYDIDVQTMHSSGEHTVAEIVQRAARLGLSGIAITDYVQDPEELEPIRTDVDAAQQEYDIDVRLGAKIKAADPQDMNDNIRGLREHVDVLVVHGGGVAVNKAAVTDTRVDVLAHPALERKDSGLDHVAVKNAADNRVSIALTVRQLLETREKVRSHVLAHMRRNVRLAQKFDAPVITASGATTKQYLRAGRDLAAFPRILGMDLKHSVATVANVPQQILERADTVNDEHTVQPGVKRVEEEDEA